MKISSGLARIFIPSFLLTALLTVTTSSNAQTAEVSWYGWQTLLSDAASGSVMLTGATLLKDHDGLSTAVVVSGLMGYELGAPVVHILHHQRGHAPASLGLRLGLPLLGGLAGVGIGAMACNPDESRQIPCTFTGLLIGGAIGMVAAPIIDAFALAYEKANRDSSRFGGVSHDIDRARSISCRPGWTVLMVQARVG